MAKIAILLNTSWNIYNFRMGLLKAIQKQGHSIIAITPLDDYSNQLTANGFSYVPVKINKWGTNPVKELKLIADLYQIFKKSRPDLLLTYTVKPNIYGNIAASVQNIPVISNISGLGTLFITENMASKIGKLLYKIALRHPTLTFFQNRDDMKTFVELGLIDSKRVEHIPGSGVNTDKLVPRHINNQNSNPIFLFIGRLLVDKGVKEYVEAAKIIKKEFPNAQFKLLGSIDQGNKSSVGMENLKLWQEQGIVKHLGTTDNVPDEIVKADCVVLPSYREGVPRSLIEAASMARPIITTDVPGCRDVVEHEKTGFLCKVRNPHDLAKQMRKIITMSDSKKREMGMRGRQKIINEFDEKIVIRKYLDAINKIIV